MPIFQKVNEISLALIRVAIQIRRSDFRSRIEGLTLDLLETTAAKDWEAVLATVHILTSLVSFGKTIYQIEPVNARILDQELDGLANSLKKNFGLNGSSDILEIFDKSTIRTATNGSNGYSQENPANNPAMVSGNVHNEESGNGNGSGSGIAATIRQSAIIDKIKQSGKVSLKDLLTELPDVSERTIRYDLQRLCGQGVLERIGNGGPSTYYIARL